MTHKMIELSFIGNLVRHRSAVLQNHYMFPINVSQFAHFGKHCTCCNNKICVAGSENENILVAEATFPHVSSTRNIDLAFGHRQAMYHDPANPSNISIIIFMQGNVPDKNVY